MNDLETLWSEYSAPAPAPRYRLAAKFSVAVGVAVAVLVPTSLSYAVPAENKPIHDLTFDAGYQLSSSDELTLTSDLGDDPLWTGPTVDSWSGQPIYRSATDFCTVILSKTKVKAELHATNDRDATVEWLQLTFPDGDQSRLTGAETTTVINYESSNPAPTAASKGSSSATTWAPT